jgi:hypothetical protein
MEQHTSHRFMHETRAGGGGGGASRYYEELSTAGAGGSGGGGTAGALKHVVTQLQTLVGLVEAVVAYSTSTGVNQWWKRWLWHRSHPLRNCTKCIGGNMGHFAKVINGVVVSMSMSQHKNGSMQTSLTNGHWVQTSYNVRGGVYYDPATGSTSG